MSSPPDDRSLEGLIADNWGNHAVRPDVLALLEPYRESAEYHAEDFDEETQSWRDYQASIFGGAIPDDVMRAVAALLDQPPKLETDIEVEWAMTPIHVCVERATTPQEWTEAYQLARRTVPSLNDGDEVRVLVTNQARAADNGPYIVEPDGAHRRP